MKAPRAVAILAGMLALLSFASTASAQNIMVPYLETFDGESTSCSTSCTATCALVATGWSQDTTDDGDWIGDANSTGSLNTGPSSDHTGLGGAYLFTEATGCGGDVNNLITPPIMVNTTTTEARFWYHMFGGDMGTMHVDASTDGGVTWTNDIIPAFTDNVDLWQNQIVPLSAYNGQVVTLRIRGVVGPDFESDMAIDDFSLVDTAINVAVTDVQAGGCGAGMMETVNVELTNGGIANAAMIPISFSVDGGPLVTEMVAGPIGPSSTTNYTFTATADLSGIGPHTVVVTAAFPNDGVPSDDTFDLTTTTASKITVMGGGFLDNLESPFTPQIWASTGPGDEWEWGTPTDALVGGTTSGQNAWATDLNSTYASDVNAALEGFTCYDFTGVTSAAIAVQINYDLEEDFDGVVLQATTDDGATWTTVGDAVSGTNWYNSTAIASNPGGAGTGWTGDGVAGTNGSYVLATTSLNALAGQSEVRFRFIMTSDGSASDEGFAFDDLGIYDVGAATVALSEAPVPIPVAGVAAGATDLLVQGITLTGVGASNLSINSVTITKTGTIADANIAAAKLWLDDGDGVFDALVDTQLDSQTIAAGAATFNTTGQVALTEFLTARLWVTYDLGAGAMPGDTLGSSIAMATDVVEANASTVSAQMVPVLGPDFVIFGVAAPPILDDFNSSVAARNVQVAGDFPTATAVGTTIGTDSFTNDGRVAIGGTATALVPIDGPAVFTMDYPDGIAAAALDYHVDLSAFNAMNDDIVVQFRWSDNAEEDINDAEYVFVSTDGGTTWEAAIYDIDPTAATDNTWNDVQLDLSALFVQYNLSFTNNVVIRFQGQDDVAFTGGDGYQYDRVFIGQAATVELERMMGTAIPDNTTDALGQIPATAQSLTYTVNNLGDLPLTIDDQSFATASTINVSNVMVTPVAAPIVVPAGGSTTFQVDFNIDAEGPFGLTVSFDYTGEGDASASTQAFTLAGEGVAAGPEIDLQRPAGTPLASGQVDVQGEVEIGMQQMLTYTIENVGFDDLDISGATVANDNNVTASVSMAPSSPVAAMMSTTLEVTYAPTADGVFSFDIQVANSDSDEDPYVITVYGFGNDPNGGTGGGGTTTTGAGGMSTTSGAGGSGTDPEDDGGCSCRVPNGEGGNEDLGLIAFAVLGLAAARRRRHRVA